MIISRISSPCAHRRSDLGSRVQTVDGLAVSLHRRSPEPHVWGLRHATPRGRQPARRADRAYPRLPRSDRSGDAIERQTAKLRNPMLILAGLSAQISRNCDASQQTALITRQYSKQPTGTRRIWDEWLLTEEWCWVSGA